MQGKTQICQTSSGKTIPVQIGLWIYIIQILLVLENCQFHEVLFIGSCLLCCNENCSKLHVTMKLSTSVTCLLHNSALLHCLVHESYALCCGWMWCRVHCLNHRISHYTAGEIIVLFPLFFAFHSLRLDQWHLLPATLAILLFSNDGPCKCVFVWVW